MAHIYTFTMTGHTDLGGYMKTNLSKTKHGTHVHNQETWHKRGFKYLLNTFKYKYTKSYAN